MNLQKILGDIRKADLDYGLIQDGDRIGVGVSGGKDSMVLLTALHMYSKFKGKNFKVIGIHIKLGFPNMDFQEVVSFCEKHGIESHQFDSKVYDILKMHPDKDGKIKCSLCSKFKKATVNEAAKELNCNKVAFGHHADDAIETLMMNAIYGGKISTFLPMMYLSKADITFIRPLIYSYESDILQALEINQIPFVKSTCPNDGYTQRQAMKDMLTSLYETYPMAKQNFLTMLSNEEQNELWHRIHTEVKPKDKDQQAEILLEEDGMAIAQRGTHYFLVYTPKEEPKQKRHLRIEKEDAWKALQHICKIQDIYEKYVK